MNKISLSDILFIPRVLFKNITDNVLTLYIGIFFVGAINIIFPLLSDFKKFFWGRTIEVIFFNVVITSLFIIITGFLKVTFFSYPTFDFFKFLKHDKDIKTNYMFIKFMKVYIIAHFIVIPINVMLYTVLLKSPELLNNSLPLSIIILLFPIWFFSIITKGINIIFEFKAINKLIVFATVFFWDSLLSICLEYAMNRWVFVLYK